MKIYLILGLLVTAAYAEKKINLEDIERDNLRAESKAKTENIRTEETKYAVRPNVNQQQYQIPSQYNTLGGHSEQYYSSQQLQDVKYNQGPSEGYAQPNQYAVHEAQYKRPSQILSQQNVPPPQYYNGYQQQAEISTKGAASIDFGSQKLNYQPEVAVGNQIQSVQQKAVTEKYTKAYNKEPVYFDIPTTQLLSYYPHLNINSLVQLNNAGLTHPSLYELTGSAAQQISIPVYTPVYNQKQLVSPVKIPYSTVAPTFTTKVTNGPAYTFPITSKKFNSSPAPLLTTPLYVQPQQPPTQGKTLLHTQAYIQPQPPQPQYVQQLVYTQPGLIYSDHAAAYSDLYARIPAYVQDNSLYGQLNQYQTQQQVYVKPTIAHETSKEILQEQVSQDLPQNYVKTPEDPSTHFVPPQLPAQDFKSGVTQLQPVPYEDEQSLPVQDHSLPEQDHSLPVQGHSLPSQDHSLPVHGHSLPPQDHSLPVHGHSLPPQDYSFPSAPRSLLDSYIPSNIIAAQDSDRYRERPIKLEGGFLPSKVNYAFKKRKSE